MGKQVFSEVLTTQDVIAAAFNNYTTAKSVIDQTALFQMPPNGFKPGSRFRVKVFGSISNIVTTPGTMSFQIKIGSAAAWSSGNVQLNASAHTTKAFYLEIEFFVNAAGTGTSAAIVGVGLLNGIMFTATAGQTDDANTPGAFVVPTGDPAAGSGFDSTVANIVDFWVGFSIADSGNQVKIAGYSLESLN